MPQHFFDIPAAISLCPEKFLEVHGDHAVIRLVAHAVALNPPVMDAREGSAADDIESAVSLEKFQGGGNLRILLELIKKSKVSPSVKRLDGSIREIFRIISSVL